ncbi:hypothetical protein PMKS-003822 [Pichia membranifaciens]|uniref:BZIP domain-containing protein n=1 Tax=Pichia membranifaciens TaxID=4926 RepID=A0A1Q2YL91_9ASCO|nr:hypothetical protein PMKS-003822 [Pichia membranifaciens]
MVFKNILLADINETENRSPDDEALVELNSKNTREEPNTTYRPNSGHDDDEDNENDGDEDDDADDADENFDHENERVHDISKSAVRGHPKSKKESVSYSDLAETTVQNTLLSGGSLTAEELKTLIEEKRRKNLEASIRFRLKKKNKANDLMKKIQTENEKIADFKTKLHKLEIENTCLRKMLVGNWNPQTDSELLQDEGMLNSSVSGEMTNIEILRNLKRGKYS